MCQFNFYLSISQNLSVMEEEEEFGKVLMVCSFYVRFHKGPSVMMSVKFIARKKLEKAIKRKESAKLLTLSEKHYKV